MLFNVPIRSFIDFLYAIESTFDSSTSVVKLSGDSSLTEIYAEEYWKTGEFSSALTTGGISMTKKRKVILKGAIISSVSDFGFYLNDMTSKLDFITDYLAGGVSSDDLMLNVKGTVNTSYACDVAGAASDLADCVMDVATTSYIAAVAHGLTEGNPVYFYRKGTNDMPTYDDGTWGGNPLPERETFYVFTDGGKNKDKFQIEKVKGSKVYIEFDCATTTCQFSSEDKQTAMIKTDAAHGLKVDDNIWFQDEKNGMPYLLGGAQLDVATKYYVTVSNAKDLEISTTKGGTSLLFTSTTDFHFTKVQNLLEIDLLTKGVASGSPETFAIDEVVY